MLTFQLYTPRSLAAQLDDTYVSIQPGCVSAVMEGYDEDMKPVAVIILVTGERISVADSDRLPGSGGSRFVRQSIETAMESHQRDVEALSLLSRNIERMR